MIKKFEIKSNKTMNKIFHKIKIITFKINLNYAIKFLKSQ